MNREIKFRGKVYHYGNDCGWVYGDFYRYYNGSLHYTIVSLDEFETKEYAVEISTVGQYTGLLDKNKTEIYEGDIVKWSSWVLGSVYEKNNPKKINVVEWSTKRGKWFVDKDLWDLGAYSDIEVIGNIYENPELIPTKD